MTIRKTTTSVIFITLLALSFFSCSNSKPEENDTIQKSSTQEASVTKNDTKLSKTKDTGKMPIVTFIELGSENCVPCKMMKPVMEQVEDTYGEKVKVVFYDIWTDEDKDKAQKYGIRAIPTQVFLDSEGNEYFRHEGFFSFDQLNAVLKQGGIE